MEKMYFLESLHVLEASSADKQRSQTKGKTDRLQRGRSMDVLLIVNWVLFGAVLLYALGLFAYLLKTRYDYLKLGRKEEFNLRISERVADILEKVFGQSKL